MSILNKRIEAVYGRTAGIVNTQTKVPPIQFHPEPEETLVDYHIYGNMTQAASKQYSISETPPVNFKSDGSGLSAWDIYGNLTQAAEQEYTIEKTTPYNFNSNGNGISAYNVKGNMSQASSQEYNLTGTSPMNFNSDGNGLSAYSITGNLVQSGAPTPSAPITPEETGDKTANLCNVSTNDLLVIGTGSAYAYTLNDDCTITIPQGKAGYLGFKIKVSPLTTYTVHCTGKAGAMMRVYEYSAEPVNTSTDRVATPVNVTINNSNTEHFTTTEETTWILFHWYVDPAYTQGDNYTISEIMCVLGSYTVQTLPTYEPYGYKIPITTNGTTQTAYLTEPIRKIGDYADSIDSTGTVTRYVRKLVLTGEENWVQQSMNPYGIVNYSLSVPGRNTSTRYIVCTHYEMQTTVIADTTAIGIFNGSNIFIRETYLNINNFKNYLRQQYAAGTPVCVWYVLETPETETFTAPTITTISGSNALTVDTTLNPNSISITTTSSVYPLNPIYPIECGERTGNLFNINSTTTDENGNTCNGIELPAGKYYITNNSNATIYWRIGISTTSSTQINPSAPYVYINANDTLVIWVGSGNNGKIMVNSGNAALPYEPYGYKIPITINNTTNNIYTSNPIRKIGDYIDIINSDGTVSRSIYEMVLTGSESIDYISVSAGSLFRVTLSVAREAFAELSGFCSHYSVVSPSNRTDGTVSGANSTTTKIDFIDNRFTASTDFQQWLINQYNAGTPVTVWYVLSTLITETITPPTLTTINGVNNLSIGTTIQPTSMSLTTTSSVYPDNPIIPEECGDKTANLFNGLLIGGHFTSVDFDTAGDVDVYKSIKVFLPAGTYVFSWGKNVNIIRTIIDGTYTQTTYNDISSRTITSTTDSYVGISFRDTTGAQWDVTTPIMLNSGSTSLPYEPYGYKLPITLAGTTQTIYLNEPIRKIGTYSDSIGEDGIVTRNIKKLVLTGQEQWGFISPTFWSNLPESMMFSEILCTHYKSLRYSYSDPFSCTTNRGQGVSIWINDDRFSGNKDDFKAYLASQYAAGTPVTVWYVLATPTTETITVPTLTTINGNNTISISTALNPSSISLTTVSSVYPKNPITPVECGDYISSGTYAGKYQVQVILNESPYNIYTAEPIRKIGNYSDSINADNTVSRYIKKIVLTGQEQSLTLASYDENRTVCLLSNIPDAVRTVCICSHIEWKMAYSTTEYNRLVFGTARQLYISIENSVLSEAGSLSAFKQYLADEYAAGTPVTVWYVLATPESETIVSPSLSASSIQGLNVITTQTNLQVSNLSISYNAPEYSEIVKVYDNLGNLVYRDPKYYDWNVIRKMVRNGNAPDLYPVGTIFYDNFNPETGTAYQVVAYDNHFDPTLTAQGYTHSMTLCELLLTDVITFDAQEAFLYTEVDIPAGTYKFTIPNYDSTYGGNKTYYFTSTATLPSGSQIVMNWPYPQTPKTVTGYVGPNPQTNTTALSGFSSLTLTEWVDGTSPEATDLGTIAGPTTQLGTSNYGQMNHIHRARYGSNNYLQSGIRQYINSNSAANAWWTPQTVFDRPYGSRASAGRLTKLNQDLVSVIATPEIKSRTNSYFETTSLDGTTFTLSTDYTINTDKMFLLSPMEVNFNTTDTTIGTTLNYYVGADNDKRIKLRKSNNTAYYWWLRTPYPSNAYNVRTVNTSGALNHNTATNSYGAAPACVIQ